MSFAALILAAGKSTRMQSAIPKVLHKIAGQSMLHYSLQAAKSAGAEKIAVVIGQNMQDVADSIAPIPCIIQHPARGTGHAVQCAAEFLSGYTKPVLVLYGDTPFLRAETLRELLKKIESGATIAVAGFYPDDPGQYGRLSLNQRGELESIIEFADCTPQQKTIAFCNAGLMAADGKRIAELLNELTPKNAQGEFYLTDLVAIARAKNYACAAIEASTEEFTGINTRAQLAEAEQIAQSMLRQKFLAAGVGMTDPNSVYFSYDTDIAPDVTIEPHVFIGPNVKIDNGARIKAFSHVEGAHIQSNATIGPFARLRPGTVLGKDAHIGNFVEIKNTRIGDGAKAGHLSYLGDTHVGADANIGGGTITCNYDGFEKHRTEIGAGAFVGSNSALVAPVKIGDGAIIAAGSVITDNVDTDALAIGRAKQISKPGWAQRFRNAMRIKKQNKSAS